jgi:hypothetical protein
MRQDRLCLEEFIDMANALERLNRRIEIALFRLSPVKAQSKWRAIEAGDAEFVVDPDTGWCTYYVEGEVLFRTLADFLLGTRPQEAPEDSLFSVRQSYEAAGGCSHDRPTTDHR